LPIDPVWADAMVQLQLGPPVVQQLRRKISELVSSAAEVAVFIVFWSRIDLDRLEALETFFFRIPILS